MQNGQGEKVVNLTLQLRNGCNGWCIDENISIATIQVTFY